MSSEKQNNSSLLSKLVDGRYTVTCRRTEFEDLPQIPALCQPGQAKQLYGEINFPKLLETAYLALSQIDKRGQLVAIAFLFDYPNVPSIPPWCWLQWLKYLYRLERATVQNTLFIHFLAWSAEHTYTFLKPLLEYAFLSYVWVQHIILVCPPKLHPGGVVEEYFTRIMPPMIEVFDFTKVQRIYVCLRQRIVPKLKIRRAVEEDYDDVMPIFNKLTDRLRECYGDYSLAELIAYPTEERQVIVAEVENVAVGLCCLNSKIDLKVLNERFDLDPFYGLHQMDEQDVNFIHEEGSTEDSKDNLRVPTTIRSDQSLSSFSTVSNLEKIFVETESSESSKSTIEIEETMSDDYIFIEDDQGSTAMLLDCLFDDNEEEELEPEDVPETSATNLTVPLSSESFIERLESQRQKIPVYYGAQNAFAIELFGLNENMDERLCFDFLEAAFECFPRMDYCIITLPAAYPSMTLLDHFVRVTPRPDRAFQHELFAVHRDAVLSPVQVRSASCDDQMEVYHLLSQGVLQSDDIRTDYVWSVTRNDCNVKSFVMTSSGTVVGIAVVTWMPKMDVLRANYDLEAYTQYSLCDRNEHGFLKHMALCPIFQMHARFFLREIHRLTDFTCLYYQYYLLDQKPDNVPPYSLISVLSEMIPIKPRRQIAFYLGVLEDNVPQKQLNISSEPPFSLFLMSKRLSTIKKVTVNCRLVIVGASETALAFLETLLFGPESVYLNFTNVTVVSVHGLPGDPYPHTARDTLRVYKGSFNSEQLARLFLRSQVNVVYGIMTGINRKKQYIHVSGDLVVYYDYLILFCGEQFQKPECNVPIIKRQLCAKHEQPKDTKQAEFPRNIFFINTEMDASNSLTILRHLIGHEVIYNVIVYGHCIDAFACIAALQEFGIPNTNIIFVEPFPNEPHAVSVFNDPEMDEYVMSNLRWSGITVYTPYYFYSWEMNDESKTVSHAIFESRTKRVTLECVAIFFYGEKTVSQATFLSVTRASLVYDGRLVINREFGTSDPHILAAGTFTKYTRRYYADHMSHRYFNSCEIGETVAKFLMKKLDHTIEEDDDDDDLTTESEYHDDECDKNDKMNVLVPWFTKPLVVSCRLPNGYNYLHVRKPGKMLPMETAVSQEDYGDALMTGGNHSDNGYFRIHLNTNSCVETITCYTKKKIEADNLITLYGKHQRLLNNMVKRFESGFIQDFFQYFREPWTYVLFHDRFNQLQKENHQFIYTTVVPGEKSLMGEIVEAFTVMEMNKQKKISMEDRKELLRKYNASKAKADITERVMQFISDHRYHLSMYVYPEMIRRLLVDCKDNELFKAPPKNEH